MGRRAGQLKVAFIEDRKARNLAFKRRKEGVMTKIKELSTLCDVSTCLILHAPDHDAPTAPSSVWPPNDQALVLRLIHHKWAKNPNSKNDDEVAQFNVRLVEKAQQIRAQIDRLKSDQQDQFASTAAMVMPSGANRDGDELEQRELRMDDAQQQDQFGDFLDNSSTTMMMKMRDEHAQFVIDDQYHQFGDLGIDDQDHQFGGIDDQFQQQDQFGPVDLDQGSSPMWWLLEEEDLLMVRPLVIDETEFSMGYSSSYQQHPQQQQQYEMWQEEDSLINPGFHHERETAVAELIKQRESMGYNSSSSIHGNNYPQMQQQYQLFGPVVDLDSSSSMYQEEEDLTMMCPLVIDEVVDLGQSSSPTWQDDPFCEQTATETAAADFYDGDVGELFTQLYTPPRMMWV